jgi:hypothetical protein
MAKRKFKPIVNRIGRQVVTVSLVKDVYKRLKAYCKKNDCLMSGIVNQMVDHCLKDMK